MKYLKKHKIIFGIILLMIVLIIISQNINYEESEILELENKTDDIVKIEEETIKNIETPKEIIMYKVDVKGAVKNPGVYDIEKDKRVIDVINKAGGLLNYSNTSTINLSKYVEDEMVIIVYTNDEINKLKEENIKIEYIEKECVCPEIKNDACIENIEPETNLININTATLEELMTIPKIGESKAKDIIKYREENNGFKTKEEIKNINGIKDATYDALKEYITI